MGHNIWSRRSTRLGVIAAVVLILVSMIGFWYVRTMRITEAGSLQATVGPHTMQHKQLANAATSTPAKVGAAPYSMQKQSSEETGEHKR